mgnify:CR=1 FL=1
MVKDLQKETRKEIKISGELLIGLVLVIGVIIILVLFGGKIFGGNKTGLAVTQESKFGYASENEKIELAIDVLAPDFSLTDLRTGQILTRNSFKDKPLLIHFFASWCPRCDYTGKNIARFDNDVGDERFNVLAVSIDPRTTDEEAKAWLSRVEGDDWYLAKLDKKVERDYDVRFLDQKYLLDKKGVIKHKDSQTWDYNEAKQFIEPLL